MQSITHGRTLLKWCCEIWVLPSSKKDVSDKSIDLIKDSGGSRGDLVVETVVTFLPKQVDSGMDRNSFES